MELNKRMCYSILYSISNPHNNLDGVDANCIVGQAWRVTMLLAPQYRKYIMIVWSTLPLGLINEVKKYTLDMLL